MPQVMNRPVKKLMTVAFSFALTMLLALGLVFGLDATPAQVEQTTYSVIFKNVNVEPNVAAI